MSYTLEASPVSSPGADAELRLKRTLVHAFLENVPAAVYFKDRQSRFIAVSRSKAARHQCSDPADLIGKTDADLFAPVHAQLAKEDEEAVMATGVPLLGKIERLKWTDGRVTWARTSKLPLCDENGAIVGTFGITEDITAAKQMEESLEKAHRDLLQASRTAGMAEVATGVLHNVGNVLNSVNVSANVITAGLQRSKVDTVLKLAALLESHPNDLGAFLATDPKGKLVPELLRTLGTHLAEERTELLREVESLQRNIEHIKEIVAMQQAHATTLGVVEALAPAALVEDAVRMNASALARHEVRVVRDFQPVPAVLADRGRVLQILINLIRNAKYALDDNPSSERILTLRLAATGDGRVRIIVADNGVGIPAENLPRLFHHGFTTRPLGHGFGLHSCAQAAKDLGGTLIAESDGPGRGARFTLDLPAQIHPPAPA